MAIDLQGQNTICHSISQGTNDCCLVGGELAFWVGLHFGVDVGDVTSNGRVQHNGLGEPTCVLFGTAVGMVSTSLEATMMMGGAVVAPAGTVVGEWVVCLWLLVVVGFFHGDGESLFQLIVKN